MQISQRKRSRNDRDISIPSNAEDLTPFMKMPQLENLSQRDLKKREYPKSKKKKHDEFHIGKVKTETKAVISPIEVIPSDIKTYQSKNSEHSQAKNRTE